MAFIVIKRPFLAVFPKRKRLQWQIFAPAASPSVSRHGASLQVSPESARNQLSTGGPETSFFLPLIRYDVPMFCIVISTGILLKRRSHAPSRTLVSKLLTPLLRHNGPSEQPGNRPIDTGHTQGFCVCNFVD